MQKEWVDGPIMIRPYQPEDLDAYLEAVHESAQEVGRWLDWCYEGYSREAGEAWLHSTAEAWEQGQMYIFGIFDTTEGAYLGSCGLNALNILHNFANLGYWIRTSRTGSGIAPRSARLLARFGFIELGLTRIEVVVSVHNEKSLRVAEKIGAFREGILRNRLMSQGRTEDAVMFSLTPSDFRDPKKMRPTKKQEG